MRTLRTLADDWCGTSVSRVWREQEEYFLALATASPGDYLPIYRQFERCGKLPDLAHEPLFMLQQCVTLTHPWDAVLLEDRLNWTGGYCHYMYRDYCDGLKRRLVLVRPENQHFQGIDPAKEELCSGWLIETLNWSLQLGETQQEPLTVNFAEYLAFCDLPEIAGLVAHLEENPLVDPPLWFLPLIYRLRDLCLVAEALPRPIAPLKSHDSLPPP